MTYYHKTATQLAEGQLTQGLKGFESKFKATVADSKEYRQYVHSRPEFNWDASMPVESVLQVVPMKCIHLASENLDKLIDEQYSMDRLRVEADYARSILSDMHKDAHVRDTNASVKLAWDKYQMLLELARK
jgi:hypothetical protein